MPHPATPLPFYLAPEDPPAKRELLRSALRLFTDHGYCETSIRDIADAAGCTNPALFKHFSGKDALALYLFEQCYARYAHELERVVATHTGFDRRLHALVIRFTELLDEEPEAFVYLNDNLRRFWPQVRPAMRKRSMISLLNGLLRTGVEERVISPKPDLGILVASLSGILIQFARMHYFGEFTGQASRWATPLERAMRALVTG